MALIKPLVVPLCYGFVFGLILSLIGLVSVRPLIDKLLGTRNNSLRPDVLLVDYQSLDGKCFEATTSSISGDQELHSSFEDKWLQSLYGTVSDEKLPSRYSIGCGQKGSFFAEECLGGSLMYSRFIGDKSIPGIRVLGVSNEVSHQKSCSPICGGERNDKTFGYQLPIQNGKYAVSVYVTEPWWQSEKARIFSVTANGKYILKDFDLFATLHNLEFVYKTPFVAVDVYNEVLEIKFSASVDNALCNAITVIPYEEAIANHVLPLPLHTVCTSMGREGLMILGKDKKALRLSLIAKLPGNILVQHYKPEYTGEYKILEHVGKENVTVFSGQIQASGCRCPKKFSKFLTKFHCPEKYGERSATLFSAWAKSKISESEFLGKRAPSSLQATHCAIINNKLYCKRNVQKESEWMSFKNLLFIVLSIVRVSDVEFYWHGSGKPLLEVADRALPVLSSVHNANFTDIPIPSGELVKFAFNGKFYVAAANGVPFDKKSGSVYFADEHRKGAAEVPRAMSRDPETQDLISIGNSWHESVDERFLSVSGHKLVLHLDGHRKLVPLCFVMPSRTVAVQQKKATQEWFEEWMKPEQHFIEVEEDLGNLAGVVHSALMDFSKLEAVSREALMFAHEHFSQASLLCWTSTVLEDMSSVLAFTPKVRAGMTKLSPPVKPCRRCL